MKTHSDCRFQLDTYILQIAELAKLITYSKHSFNLLGQARTITVHRQKESLAFLIFMSQK